jgi:hypothetical protein
MPAPEWPDELGGLRLELRDHLKRLAIWSGISVLVGIKLIGLFANAEVVRSAGVMTAGWAVVNLIIVGASWNGKPPASRAQFREFIWLNQGLNAGYVGVGLALALAGSSAAVVGSGWAVVPQGLALLVLDGILLRRVPR